MLSKTETVILGLIHKQPLNAYEIIKILAYMNMKYWYEIADSTVYAALKTMDKKSYIKGRVEKSGSKPEKTIYTLTPYGESELKQTISAYISNIDYDTVPFSIAGFFIEVLDKAEITDLMQKRQSGLLKQLDNLSSQIEHIKQKDISNIIVSSVERNVYILEAELKSTAEFLIAVADKTAEKEEIDNITFAKLNHQIASRNHKKILQALNQISIIGFWKPQKVQVFLPGLKQLLDYENPEIVSKTVWAFGQVGFNRADLVDAYLPDIAELLNSREKNIRSSSLWALGRISRNNKTIATEYMDAIIRLANDSEPEVRMNVIWACENIAVNSPELVLKYINIFLYLLFDPNKEYVRREAPEIFRVLGERSIRVNASIPMLKKLATEDSDKVVRSHAISALKVQQGLTDERA